MYKDDLVKTNKTNNFKLVSEASQEKQFQFESIFQNYAVNNTLYAVFYIKNREQNKIGSSPIWEVEGGARRSQKDIR